MFRKTLLSTIVFIAFASSIVLCEKDRAYTILMPGSYSVSGKNTEQMEKFTKEIVLGLSKSVDVEIRVEISPLHDEQFMLHGLLRMLKKDVDFVGMSGDWYVRMSPWLRSKFPVFFGLVIDKRKFMNYCFFVRKSDEIESLEGLRGKILGGSLYLDARFLLYRAGIDEPVTDFFSEYIYMQVPYSEMMTELVENRIDVFVSWDFNVDTTMNVDPRFMNIEKTHCKTYGLNPFVVHREGIDPELIKQSRKALMNWKTNPNFQNVRLFFVGIKGGITELDEDDLGLNLKLDELNREKGWAEEHLEFLEEYRPQ